MGAALLVQQSCWKRRIAPFCREALGHSPSKFQDLWCFMVFFNGSIWESQIQQNHFFKVILLATCTFARSSFLNFFSCFTVSVMSSDCTNSTYVDVEVEHVQTHITIRKFTPESIMYSWLSQKRKLMPSWLKIYM